MLKVLTWIVGLIAIGYYYLRYSGYARVREPHELYDTYDYVVVGGGTAGCVLAARLSEDPAVSVLVLEAGDEEDQYWFSHIPGLVPHLQLTDFDWEYLTEPQKHCCESLVNRQGRWPRGKGLGGCSTHNYMNYVRCSPKDFDHWAHDLNNSGWSFRDVLPYFKKMESYQIDHLDGQQDIHGYNGPLKINEGFRTPLGIAVSESMKNAGYKFSDDTNGNEFEGAFSWLQFNIDKQGRRMSTAKTYLRPAMQRPNLHVAVRTHVSKVLIEPRPESLVATGVEYYYNNLKHTVKARREVILSGGAINSPQLLLLSGIGPRHQLDQYYIPVVQENDAVGANMEDHVIAFLEYKTNASGLTDGHLLSTWHGYYKALGQYYLFGTGPLTKTATEIMGFFRSGLRNSPGPDLQLYFTMPYPWMDNIINMSPEATRRRSVTQDEISFVFGAVHLHASDRGQIRLRSANPFAHPIIDHQYLQDQLDVDILAKGLSMLVDLVERPELKPFDVQYSEVGPVPGCEEFKPLSDEYIKCSVRNRAVTLYHPVGTCRMGQRGENSVVDNELRVHGVQGLRVVDASVFPAQVSGNTHAPVVMLAEKASDLIKKDRA